MTASGQFPMSLDKGGHAIQEIRAEEEGEEE
jgi:hypothetical protein